MHKRLIMIQAAQQHEASKLLPRISLQKAKKETPSNNLNTKVILPTSDGSIAIKVEEISFFKSNDMYCFLYTIYGERFFITRSLKWTSTKIEHPLFQRIHKSYLINTYNIFQYLKADGGQLQMECKSLIPIARSKRPMLTQWTQP